MVFTYTSGLHREEHSNWRVHKPYNFYMDKYKRLQEIISRVKKEHVQGKDLKEILRKELRKAGIDPTKVNLEDALESAADISEILDYYIYEPWFCSHAGTVENGVLDALVQFGHSRKIEDTLTLPKLFLASLSVIFFMAGMLKFKINPVYGLLYLVFSHDCFRMSYNCYSKRYYSLAGCNLVTNPTKMASTLYNLAAQTMGAIVEKDPLSEIKDNVQWHLIVHSTFCKYVYDEVIPILLRQYNNAIENSKNDRNTNRKR